MIRAGEHSPALSIGSLYSTLCSTLQNLPVCKSALDGVGAPAQ